MLTWRNHMYEVSALSHLSTDVVWSVYGPITAELGIGQRRHR